MNKSDQYQNLRVFVGSTNPVKVNAIKIALEQHLPQAIVSGIEVSSGVSPQPFSDQETQQGATNRAKAALEAGIAANAKTSQDEVCLGVGLEGGVFTTDEGAIWSTVWVVVVDQAGKLYPSSGARFPLPAVVEEGLRRGEEMGTVASEVTGVHNVKQNQGLIGVITSDFVSRTEEYAAIAKMSLGLWYGRNWQAEVAVEAAKKKS